MAWVVDMPPHTSAAMMKPRNTHSSATGACGQRTHRHKHTTPFTAAAVWPAITHHYKVSERDGPVVLELEAMEEELPGRPAVHTLFHIRHDRAQKQGHRQAHGRARPGDHIVSEHAEPRWEGVRPNLLPHVMGGDRWQRGRGSGRNTHVLAGPLQVLKRVPHEK